MSESQTDNKLWSGTIPSAEAVKKAQSVKLILMDVDGVLTNGKTYYLPQTNGSVYETKGFDSQDGLAFYFLKDAGMELALSVAENRKLLMSGLKICRLNMCAKVICKKKKTMKT